MWNSRKVGEWIERRSGKALSRKKQSGWEYMKRLGQSPKVPRPHHARADEHEQEAFKKALDEGDEAQGELPDGQGGALWCEDEARLGLKPIVRKVWSPIGQRALVKVHQRYEWTYPFTPSRTPRAESSTGSSCPP